MSKKPVRTPKKSRSVQDLHVVRGSPTVAVRTMSGILHRTPSSLSTSSPRPADYFFAPRTDKGKREARTHRDNRVQVAVRIRPPNRADGNTPDVAVTPDGLAGIRITNRAGEDKRFAFDHVFTAGQDEVYDCVGRPMLRDALEGYNVTLFAYGQTGAGKTWSILGPDGSVDQQHLQVAGILPRFCKDLLAWAEDSLENDPSLSIKIALSMLEIYNERVRDLLEKKRGGEPTPLEVHETKDRKVFVEGLSLHTVTNYERFVALTQKGLSARQTHETNMNEVSSRSHCILQIYVAQTHDPPRPGVKDVESVINIVDLAGSERQGKTAATGERFEESKKINHSLMMLGRALNAFSDSDGRADFVPLRDSKLTRLLSESFGGNARTWMLACVSPSLYNYSESMSTLQYAQNAKAIVNKAHVNAMREKLELKQLQQKYAALERLYDAEREKNEQLVLELRDRGEHLHTLQRHLDRAAMAAPNPAAPTLSFCIPGTYIGRAHLHLKNILQLTSNYVTLPLITDRAECDGAMLLVATYPLRRLAAQGDEGPSALAGVLGKRIDLIVHVIGAKNVPLAFQTAVYCKYVFKHAEKDVYQTQPTVGADPEFDFKKRFAFGALTPQLADYLASPNVLTFELLGKGRPEYEPPSPISPEPVTFATEVSDA